MGTSLARRLRQAARAAAPDGDNKLIQDIKKTRDKKKARDNRMIRILQYNAQNSFDKAIAPLLRDPRLTDYAVIAIQELGAYAEVNNALHFPSEAKPRFNVVWYHGEQPRVCTLVRKGIQWQLAYISKHTISIYFRPYGKGIGPVVFVHNVYNPPKSSANEGVVALREALTAADKVTTNLNAEAEHIIMGDFNMPEIPCAGTRRLPPPLHDFIRASQFKKPIEQRSLARVTPEGSITRPAPNSQRPEQEAPLNSLLQDAGTNQEVSLSREEHTIGSSIDVCFASSSLARHVGHIQQANIDGHSDHIPVEIEFADTFTLHPPRKRNWQGKDAAEPNTAKPPTDVAPTEPEGTDQLVDQLLNSLEEEINEATLRKRKTDRPSIEHSPECLELQRIAKRRKREITNFHTRYRTKAPGIIRSAYTRAHCAFKRAVERYRSEAHCQQVTDASHDMQHV